MVIVDTSIWVDFLRSSDSRLSELIASDLVLQHPFVTAEVGMGSFRSIHDRVKTIELLDAFEQAQIAEWNDFHQFVSSHCLYGTGIGFADAHLLMACKNAASIQLATRDRKLANQAERLEICLID